MKRGSANDGHRESLGAALFSSHVDGLAGFLEQGAEYAAKGLTELFTACDAGLLDHILVDPAPPETVCLTTSCHLLAMSLRYRLEGFAAAHFLQRRSGSLCAFQPAGSADSGHFGALRSAGQCMRLEQKRSANKCSILPTRRRGPIPGSRH